MDVSEANGSRPTRVETLEQTHAFDTNLMKELLLEYELDSKIKSQEYSKFLANKKALITIIFEQWDEATEIKITLGETYAADYQAGRFIEFLNRLRTVCFGGDDSGLSYAPCKKLVAMKSLDNFSNNKPYDTHRFKEEVNIRYDSVKVTAGKFPNGTAAMMALLAV